MSSLICKNLMQIRKPGLFIVFVCMFLDYNSVDRYEFYTGGVYQNNGWVWGNTGIPLTYDGWFPREPNAPDVTQTYIIFNKENANDVMGFADHEKTARAPNSVCEFSRKILAHWNIQSKKMHEGLVYTCDKNACGGPVIFIGLIYQSAWPHVTSSDCNGMPWSNIAATLNEGTSDVDCN